MKLVDDHLLTFINSLLSKPVSAARTAGSLLCRVAVLKAPANLLLAGKYFVETTESTGTLLSASIPSVLHCFPHAR